MAFVDEAHAGDRCASHRLAPQLLGTLAEMRLSLPGELSFVTFGDWDWARAYRPAVAMIRFDRYREDPPGDL
jgi:DNA-binding LacI/PurR family transcriptional regulator